MTTTIQELNDDGNEHPSITIDLRDARGVLVERLVLHSVELSYLRERMKLLKPILGIGTHKQERT